MIDFCFIFIMNEEIIEQIRSKLNQKKIITNSIVNLLNDAEISFLQLKYNHLDLKCCLLAFKIEFIQNSTAITHCSICGKELIYRHIGEAFKNKQSRKQCQLECSRKAGILNLQEKYGHSVTNMQHIPGIMEKRRLSNINKYGVENVMQDPNIKKHAIDVHKQKNNGEFAFHKPEAKERALLQQKEKSLKSFGAPHPMLNLDECCRRNKLKDKTIMNRYGVHNIFHVKEFRQKAADTLFANHGVTNAGFLVNTRQKLEIEIFNFIKSSTDYNVLSQCNDIIQFYQLDIYIPELKLAIEVNGDYWHSTVRLHNRNRQLHKTNLCEQRGIRLIHIWESEWHQNKEFIKELLTYYLNDRIHQNEFQRLLEQFNRRLPRDYFQTLDFSGKIEEPVLEKSGKFNVYKTGYIIL